MMLQLSLLTAVVASSVVATANSGSSPTLRNTGHRQLQLLNACENECFYDFDTANDKTITYIGNCEYSEVVETISANCVECLVGASNEEDAKEKVHAMCVESLDDDYLNYDFDKITERGPQFDNEFYSGGTEWNYEIETATGDDHLRSDASRVEDVYYYEAQKKRITFPDHINAINPFNSQDREAANGIDGSGCDLNAAFCCWVQDRQANDNNGNCATPYEYNCVDKDPADNTNLCYVDHSRSPAVSHVSEGFTIFGDPKNNQEAIEGPAHCHGFAWADDPIHPSNVFKGNNLFFVSMYDHMHQRGYVRNVPGSPMCACAENMAVVTRADCTEIAASLAIDLSWVASEETLSVKVTVKDINFNACQGVNINNDLEDHMKRLEQDGLVSEEKRVALQKTLVGKKAGNCNAAIVGFLGEKGIVAA